MMWLDFKALRDSWRFAGNSYRRSLTIEDGVPVPNSARDINLANVLSNTSSGRAKAPSIGEDVAYRSGLLASFELGLLPPDGTGQQSIAPGRGISSRLEQQICITGLKQTT